MSIKKQNTYIGQELDYLEEKANNIKRFLDDNPFHEVQDRYSEPDFKGSRKVVATIEQIQTSLRNSYKDYLQIMEVVDKLRQKDEEKKLLTRGDAEMSHLAKKFTAR